jgi:3-oxoacyl-[acyl-carrier-protein] synthase II
LNHRVVITGIGAITPIGCDKDTYWKNLISGVSGVRRVSFPDVDMDQYRTQIAATVENFNPSEYISAGRKEKYFGRPTLFALAAAKQALEDAGFQLSSEKNRMRIEDIDPFKIGVIMGAASGNMEIARREAVLLAKERGPRRLSPHALPYQLISAISGNVGIMYNCHGINYMIPTACSSASQAIGNGFRHLKIGYEDILIVGGADSGINPLVFGGFVALRAMSTRNDEPEKACRPFDRERDGFVMGEGAGVIILEKLEHALKRNARIYAEVKGFGMTSDAYHVTIPELNGNSLVQAITLALDEAKMKPGDIDYINAHGTATKLNDPIETLAIKNALGKRAHEIPISSTKSLIGHLLGASGGVETIATILTIRDSMIHPTLNYEFPDPDCDLDYVPNKARKAEVKNAMSTSLGFGGFNAVLILSRYQD